MMYADTAAGRLEASPGVPGTCPLCSFPVRPKCGRIIVHHWAHHARGDCDPWAEPEGEWHRWWKLAVPPVRREVVMGSHRADVVTASGGVVELQHSAISADVIAERELFYGVRMAWIFDATEAYREGRIELMSPAQPYGIHQIGAWRDIARLPGHLAWSPPGEALADFPGVLFRWKMPRKSAAACRRTVLLDLGDDLVLRVGKFYPEMPAGGHGTLLDRESVRAWLRAGKPWEMVTLAPAPRPPTARPVMSPVIRRELLVRSRDRAAGSAKMQARREAYERRWGWTPEEARKELLPYRPGTG